MAKHAQQESRKIVIVDMDGTIADVAHRLHHIKGPGKKRWKRFFQAMHKDTPIPHIVAWVHELAEDHEIVLVTGRPEEYRHQTEMWLRQHQIPYSQLLMRRQGDHRQDFVSKKELVAKLPRERIDFAIEDRPPVCEAYRSLGLPCYEVASDPANQEVNEAYRERAAQKRRT